MFVVSQTSHMFYKQTAEFSVQIRLSSSQSGSLLGLILLCLFLCSDSALLLVFLLSSDFTLISESLLLPAEEKFLWGLNETQIGDKAQRRCSCAADRLTEASACRGFLL